MIVLARNQFLETNEGYVPSSSFQLASETQFPIRATNQTSLLSYFDIRARNQINLLAYSDEQLPIGATFQISLLSYFDTQ
jgi:hypothetical protein